MKCSSEGLGCSAHSDNLLEYIPQIESVLECRQLCQDRETECQFLTYYSDQSSPFHNDCFLFSSCEETYDCENCVSETRDCFTNEDDGTCGVGYTGLIEDNVIRVLTDMDNGYRRGLLFPMRLH